MQKCLLIHSSSSRFTNTSFPFSPLSLNSGWGTYGAAHARTPARDMSEVGGCARSFDMHVKRNILRVQSAVISVDKLPPAPAQLYIFNTILFLYTLLFFPLGCCTHAFDSRCYYSVPHPPFLIPRVERGQLYHVPEACTSPV